MSSSLVVIGWWAGMKKASWVLRSALDYNSTAADLSCSSHLFMVRL